MLFNMFSRKKRLHLHFFMLWLFLVIQSEAKDLGGIMRGYARFFLPAVVRMTNIIVSLHPFLQGIKRKLWFQ